MTELEKDMARLARHIDERRFGKYRGFVLDNADPDQAGRLQLRIPSVLGSEATDWALPCVPFAGPGYGYFAIPDPGAMVWVEFEEGDIDRPIWTGGTWQHPDQLPEGAAQTEPRSRLWRTPGGHQLRFDDEPGEERCRLSHVGGAELTLEPEGATRLTDPGGATLVLDSQGGEVRLEDASGNRLVLSHSGTVVEDAFGNRIEMGPTGITVDGTRVVVNGSMVSLAGEGGEPLIKGTSFLSLFATHVHPTSMGPSGPPIPQGEFSTLSTRTMTG